MQENKKPKKQFGLQHVQTIRCDSGMQFPYHPLITVLDIKSEVYIACKIRDGIGIYVLSEKAIEKSYSLDLESLPRSSICSLQFIPQDSVQQLKKQDITPFLYLLVGYTAGYLYLLRAQRKEVKVLYRYNRVVQQQSGLLSKTFSYFYTSSSNEYTLWQKTAVIRVMPRKNTLTYLLRNNILVHLNSLLVPGDQLQRRFEQFIGDQKILKQNSLEKAAAFTYYICKDWKMLRGAEGALIAFESTISSLYVTEEKIIVGSFEGELMFFDKVSMVCIGRLSVSVAIKTINNSYNKYVCLCLQDDSVQVLDLSTNSFLNIIGHRSFTSQSIMIDSETLLISSFDGTISITQIPEPSQWNNINSKDKQLYTWSANSKEHLVNEKYDVGRRETGVGNMVFHRDFVILSMLDSYMKIYKLCRDVKEIKEINDRKNSQQSK